MKVFSKKLVCIFAAVLICQGIAIAQSNEYETALNKFTGEHKWDIEKPGALDGVAVPDFTGTTLSGQHIKLSEFSGDVVVLNFWFIACKPCQLEVGPLNDIVSMYKGKSHVKFISIARDQPDVLKDHLSAKPFAFETIADPSAAIANDIFHIRGYPTTIVIDQQGKIRYYSLGGKIDEKAVKADLEKKLVPVIDSCLKKSGKIK